MKKIFISAAYLAVAALGCSGVASAAPAKPEPKTSPQVSWVCEKDAKAPSSWASSPNCSAPGPLKFPCEKSYCKLVPKKS